MPANNAKFHVIGREEAIQVINWLFRDIVIDGISFFSDNIQENPDMCSAEICRDSNLKMSADTDPASGSAGFEDSV